MKRFKHPLCVICSSGGHLSEALAALAKSSVPAVFVTKGDAHVADRLKSQPFFYVVDPHTSLHLYLINAWQSLGIYLRIRPKVIFSTGSGIAVFMCIWGKLWGSKIIYLESAARVVELSRTGKFLYRLADVFYVQWPDLVTKYPNAQFVGRLA